VGDWPEGVGREVLAEIDSTSAEALRRAAAGAPAPVWIMALHQTSARGRRGRPWASLPGNFAASLMMRPPGPPALAALRSFVAALGLYDALLAATGRAELFSLKWPNDVLLSGKKLAGILLETGGRPDAPLALAIGIGVNLAAAPGEAEIEPGATKPIDLRSGAGVSIAPEAFLDLLAPAVAHWEARLVNEGFAPLRNAWLARAARLGESVTARLPGREIDGRFETIDDSGALVLMTPQGRVSLPAAEIHFGEDGPGGEVPHAARH
jgi:BirA family biotin operon repressor/biotin-[acetyl-CoA-carboxylase] ligase